MLRTLLAALAVGMACCTTSFAGHHCSSCGGGGHHGQHWDNYCGDPCSSCDSCHGGGCQKCCFPLIRGTLRVVAKAVNFVIPRPCCRTSQCDSCWDPCGESCDSCDSCGTADHHDMPTYAPTRAGNPFEDDAPTMAPTPAPTRDARSQPQWKSPLVKTTPAGTKSMVMKRPTPAPLPKPTVIAKPIPRSVVKVAHEEEVAENYVSDNFSDDDGVSAPNAPRSIRHVETESVAPLAAPRTTSNFKRSSNPLR